MNVIEFNHVWKKFRKGEKFNSLRDAIPNLFRSFSNGNGLEKQEFWALQDVDFQIEKGEVLGIIGPNGAGKSTALKLLSGIMNPSKGEIKINGRLSALIEVTAGFHSELTGRENAYLNGTILGMSKKEIDNKFDQIVEFSGLKEFIDTPVKRYSSGMFSRLGFSVAAHMDPDILLVDEVLSVGDIAFQAKCAQKMRELLQSNVTIILVSHNLPLIQSLCKRIILLDKGQVQKEGIVEDVIPYYQNIVYKQQENELRKKTKAQESFVKVQEESKVKILNVYPCDDAGNAQENFKFGESISVRINYEVKDNINGLVCYVSIIRSDAVVCCSASSKEDNFLIKDTVGAKSVCVNFGSLNLAPASYSFRISFWDKDSIHLYSVQNNVIFRVVNQRVFKSGAAVFLLKAEWESV